MKISIHPNKHTKTVDRLGFSLECDGADAVINWGCSNIAESVVPSALLINSLDSVAKSVYKPWCWNVIDNITFPMGPPIFAAYRVIPDYVSWEVAKAILNGEPDSVGWTEQAKIFLDAARKQAEIRIKRDGAVVVRKFVKSSAGAGLSVITNIDDLSISQYIVNFVPLVQASRVHFFRVRNKYIYFRQKITTETSSIKDEMLTLGVKPTFIYDKLVECTDIKLPYIERIIAKSGLDFGCVDTGIDERTGHEVVFELNTAPGLRQENADLYHEMLKLVIESKR